MAIFQREVGGIGAIDPGAGNSSFFAVFLPFLALFFKGEFLHIFGIHLRWDWGTSCGRMEAGDRGL